MQEITCTDSRASVVGMASVSALTHVFVYRLTECKGVTIS